jgi:hypothetical protein
VLAKLQAVESDNVTTQPRRPPLLRVPAQNPVKFADLIAFAFSGSPSPGLSHLIRLIPAPDSIFFEVCWLNSLI